MTLPAQGAGGSAALLAGAMLVSMIIYALLGGADFGGGFWDLFSFGAKARPRRRLIADAIGPVWETNHIWIVIAVVVLFGGFPRAFALMSTVLFVPVTLVLAGIVLRGAAFAFHTYRLHEEGAPGLWGWVFGGASLLTPLLLGATVGAISSGRIRTDAVSFAAGAAAWLSPFPVSVGLLAVALFAYLAAVYLVLETRDPGLRGDFRLRALAAAAAVAFLSVAALVLAAGGAPDFHRALVGRPWSLPLMAATATFALGAGAALVLRSYRLARVCVAAQAALLLFGWGLAQYPYLVRPGLTVAAAAAPPPMVRGLLLSLAAGALFLFPAIATLFRVFKSEALLGRPPDRDGL